MFIFNLRQGVFVMASTGMLTGNALTVKKWETSDWVNMGQKAAFGHMMERGAVHFCDEFKGQRAKGDQITYEYVNKLTGIPVGEGGTMDGNEEALDLGSFTMAMNVTRIAVLNPNSDTIEQQRTMVGFPEKTRKLLPARHKELLDTAVFYHLAGSNPNSFTLNGTTWSGANKLFVQGHNAPVAPSASRIIRAGAVANDQSLTSSHKMSLDLIDYALEKIATSDQPVQAFDDDTYDLFLSPEQVTQLKHDTTSAIQWYNNQLAMVSGGMDNDLQTLGMFKGLTSIGRYANVNLYQAPRVAYGVNAGSGAVITSVRRAVLVGKDALTYASPFGRPDEASAMKYADQLKDYGYYKGLEARMIYGLKKNAATNSEDIGTFVISTYAAANA
jgi:hypothetical protein